MPSLEPLKAIAIVDDQNTIALQMLFAADSRNEWQAELDALTEKLKRKNATHSMRIVDVIITVTE